MDKTILITGSTGGKLVPIQPAKEGHTTYLHGRSQEKLDSTVADVTAFASYENIAGHLSGFNDFEGVKNRSYQLHFGLSKKKQHPVLFSTHSLYSWS